MLILSPICPYFPFCCLYDVDDLLDVVYVPGSIVSSDVSGGCRGCYKWEQGRDIGKPLEDCQEHILWNPDTAKLLVMQNLACNPDSVPKGTILIQIYHLYNDHLANFLPQMMPYGKIVITERKHSDQYKSTIYIMTTWPTSCPKWLWLFSFLYPAQLIQKWLNTENTWKSCKPMRKWKIDKWQLT